MKYKNVSLGIIGSIKGVVLVSDGRRSRQISASASSNNVRASKSEMLNNLVLDAVAKFNYSQGVEFTGSETLKRQMRNNKIRTGVISYHFDYENVDKFYKIKRVRIRGKYYVQVRDRKSGRLKDTRKWTNKIEEVDY